MQESQEKLVILHYRLSNQGQYNALALLMKYFL